MSVIGASLAADRFTVTSMVRAELIKTLRIAPGVGTPSGVPLTATEIGEVPSGLEVVPVTA